MKSESLKKIVNSLSKKTSEESSIIDINSSIAHEIGLDKYGGEMPPHSCWNQGCSGNMMCAGNNQCDSNGTCSFNSHCANNPYCGNNSMCGPG